MAEPIIRLLTHAEMREHLPKFRHLAIAAYGVYEEGLGKEEFAKMMDRFQTKEFWEEIFAKAQAIVCEAEGACVGMAFLVPSGNPWRFVKAEWAFVRMVGVLPNMQGRGIARRLMLELIDLAERQGEKIMALHTSDMMHAARHLYQDLGFEMDHELEPRGNARYWVYTLRLKG
jgi:GNAT superfamily N-acetyltransferase